MQPITTRSKHSDLGGKLTMVGGGPRHSVSQKLRDIQNVTIRRINSATVSTVVGGEFVENATETRAERYRQLHRVNTRDSFPEGARIEFEESSGTVVLYYNNEKYDPTREY